MPRFERPSICNFFHHAYAPTCTHTCEHASVPLCTSTHSDPCICTHALRMPHACTHTSTPHPCTQIHTSTHMRTHPCAYPCTGHAACCTHVHMCTHPCTAMHTHTHRIPVFPRLGHFLPCLCVGLKFLEAGAPGRGHPTSDSQFVKQAGAGLCPFGSALCPLCGEVCVNTLAETGQNCANGSAPSGDSLGEALSKSVTRCNFRTTKIIKRKKKKTTSPRGHSTVLSTKLTASAVVGTGFWWGL